VVVRDYLLPLFEKDGKRKKKGLSDEIDFEKLTEGIEPQTVL
jgi:hypothetical protein